MASIRPNTDVLKLFTVEELIQELLKREPTIDAIVSRVTDFLNKNHQKTSKNNNETKYKSGFVVDKAFEETSAEIIAPILKELKSPGFINKKEIQLKGIDFQGEFENKRINVDAKSIATNDLQTFCFEAAGNVHSGQVGWLIKEGLLTDHYLLVYHDVASYGINYKEAKRNMTLSNVNLTEAYLINKEDLLKLIKSYINSDITTIVKEIRESEKLYKGKKSSFKFRVKNGVVIPFKNRKEWDENNPEVWFTVSPQIYEQPINIVVKRNLLSSIAVKHWTLH